MQDTNTHSNMQDVGNNNNNESMLNESNRITLNDDNEIVMKDYDMLDIDNWICHDELFTIFNSGLIIPAPGRV